MVYRSIIYARLSIEDNEEINSISHQIDICNEYARNLDNVEIVKTYEDNGRTGTNFNRDGLKSAIGILLEGKAECILVKDLSRLGRNYIECGELINTFISKNIRLIAVNDNFDSYNTDSEGMFVAAMKNIINDIYSKDLSIKIASAKKIAKLNGSAAIRPKYGYKKVDKKIVEDKEKKEIVQWILTKSSEGANYNEIAKMLNNENIVPPDYRINHEKNIWKGSTVFRVIKDNCGVCCSKEALSEDNGKTIKSNRAKAHEQKQGIKICCGCCGYVISPKYYKDEARYRCQTPYFSGDYSCVRVTFKEHYFCEMIIYVLNKKLKEKDVLYNLTDKVYEAIIERIDKELEIIHKKIKTFKIRKNKLYKEYGCSLITKEELEKISKKLEKDVMSVKNKEKLLWVKREGAKTNDVNSVVNNKVNMATFFTKKIEILGEKHFKVYWDFEK